MIRRQYIQDRVCTCCGRFKRLVMEVTIGVDGCNKTSFTKCEACSKEFQQVMTGELCHHLYKEGDARCYLCGEHFVYGEFNQREMFNDGTT